MWKVKLILGGMVLSFGFPAIAASDTEKDPALCLEQLGDALKPTGLDLATVADGGVLRYKQGEYDKELAQYLGAIKKFSEKDYLQFFQDAANKYGVIDINTFLRDRARRYMEAIQANRLAGKTIYNFHEYWHDEVKLLCSKLK